jgi:hypothetical protein
MTDEENRAAIFLRHVRELVQGTAEVARTVAINTQEAMPRVNDEQPSRGFLEGVLE